MDQQVFTISLVDIRNHINVIISLRNIDNILKRKDFNIDGNIDTLTSIYTHLSKKLNKDIDSSINWDGCDKEYNKKIIKDIKLLSKYKMLFNILPIANSSKYNIYKFYKNKNSLEIKYIKNEYFKYECYDILFTRINLIVNFNNIYNSASDLVLIGDKHFNCNYFYISYEDQVKYYKKFLNKYIDNYKNLFYLLSDDFLLNVGGFLLDDFKKFFAGMYILNQFSNEMVICFRQKYPDLIDNIKAYEEIIKNIYNKCEDYNIFKIFFCDLVDLDKDIFENIIKYFLLDYDGDQLDLSGDDYIVPFFKLNGKIYFNSIFNTNVISPRNLIYAMNNLSNKKLRDNVYDNNSKKLENNFLNFMKKVFESYGLEFYESLEWNFNKYNEGEIDAIVVCKSSRKILLIQTKTVIAASSYKTLFSLQENMKKAISQLNNFNKQTETFKNEFLSNLIGENVVDYEIISCLNSDGGLGNALVWEDVFSKELIPFNTSIMILYFDKYNNLNNFRENIYNLIDNLNSKTTPKKIKCTMDFSVECNTVKINHDSTDASYMNLIAEMKVIYEKLQSI